MNELMIDYGNENWMYYRTHKETAKEAYDEFLDQLQFARIDVFNMKPLSAILRDKNGFDIDGFRFKKN